MVKPPAAWTVKGEVDGDAASEGKRNALHFSLLAAPKARLHPLPHTAYFPVLSSVQMRVYSLSTSGGMMAKVNSLASTSGGG